MRNSRFDATAVTFRKTACWRSDSQIHRMHSIPEVGMVKMVVKDANDPGAKEQYTAVSYDFNLSAWLPNSPPIEDLAFMSDDGTARSLHRV